MITKVDALIVQGSGLHLKGMMVKEGVPVAVDLRLIVYDGFS